MKGICFIILLISTITSFASERDTKSIIWYDGTTFYKALDKKKDATLFFPEWTTSIHSFLNDENYKVALQLDCNFDPIPVDDLKLPTVTELSTIDDSLLVKEYLDFLENYTRTKGIDYLVLPDTIGLSAFEKEVITLAADKSPYYFILETQIFRTLPYSRKEISTSNLIIWIADQSSSTKKFSRWSRKLSKGYYKSFQEGMLDTENFETIEYYPPSLSRRIFEKGAVAIEENQDLPIEAEAVIYLGRDDELREWLSKYATVYEKRQPENFPVILDRRRGFDGKVFGNEIIIDFIGSEISENSTSLLVPGELENGGVIISKMLFGSQHISGRLELRGNRKVQTKGFIGHSSPSFEGMDEKYLILLEDYVEEAIREYATPGSQLSIVKNGSIIMEKSYGHFTYDSLRKLSNKDVFDLASITKVVATLPAIALLIDQGKISLDDSIGQHLTNFQNSNKSHITIKQLLAHNGGVRSYIPFWRRTMNSDDLNTFHYKTKEDESLGIRSYGLVSHPALKDSLENWIKSSDLIKNTNMYNYSDLGYMVLHLLVEAVSEKSFDQFMDENFYDPMRLNMTFNPQMNGYSLENIVPTEYDESYRNDQVWGEVHDRNAHIFGGVAGHAGLFSNSSDLAKMMFMLSSGGYYNGKQYLKKETLDAFNFRYFENNRRGLGWDKKDWENDAASLLASDSSFGHTGFTGTMVWADPEKDLIFIFLSNRIYPDANNSKLMELNTRTEIHDVIYQSILND